MRHPTRALAAVLVPVILLGCSDKRTPDKANFTAALDRHFAAHCLFITPAVGITGFPVSVTDGVDAGSYDALVSAGLLVGGTATSEHPGPLGIGTERSTTRTYALTPAGQAAWRADAGARSDAGGGFCIGRYTVSAIDGFTVPTASDGVTVSRVTFAVTPHLDPWTTNGAVQNRYGGALAAIRPTTEGATLVLTDQGWAEP